MKTTTQRLFVLGSTLPLFLALVSMAVFAQAVPPGDTGGRGGQQQGGGIKIAPLPGDVCAPCTTKLDCSANNYCYPTALHCSSDQKVCAPGAKLGDPCQGGGQCLGVCGPLGDNPPACDGGTPPTFCTLCDTTPQGQCAFPDACHTESGMKYCSITNLSCNQLALGERCAPTVVGAHPQDICKGTCRNGIGDAPLCAQACIAGTQCAADAQCGDGTCTKGVCVCPTICDPKKGNCGCGDTVLDPDGPDDTVGTNDDEECEAIGILPKITQVIYDTTVPKKLQIFSVSDNGIITLGGTDNCLGCQIRGVCGDGFVDGTGTYGPKEQCDDGEILKGKDKALSGDGCDTNCKWELPTCTLAISGSVYSGHPVEFVYSVGNSGRQDASALFPLGDPNAISPIVFPQAPYKGGTIMYIPGYTPPPANGKAVLVVVHTGTFATGMCMVNFTIDYCGDGKIQKPYEQCDDGNTNNDDGCRNDCTSDLACTLAVQPTIISSGESVQITVKITKGYQNLTKLLLTYGDGKSDLFTPPFAPPPPDDVLEMIHTYTSDGEFKPMAFLSGLVNGQELSAACDCDCVVVTGEYKFWKEGVLSGSTIFWHIYGELPPTVKTFTVKDTLVGNSTIDTGSFIIDLNGQPYTLIPPVPTDKTFTLEGKGRPADGNFDIRFTSHAHRGGNQEICNGAELSFDFQGKTIVEQSDDYTHGKTDEPVCVSGYDLDIDKTILTSGEFATIYKPEYNTYAPYAKENGQVMTGNRYIYRVKVTNNGAGDAYDVLVDDTLPAGVTAFWMEPSAWQELFGGPVDFTPDLPLAKSFKRVISKLLVGESKMIDIFVQLGTGAQYTRGQQYCNVAYAQAEGEAESPISDDACLTVSGACFRTCSGTVFAKEFSRDMQGNDMIVNATCIAETTCGESKSFPADPAVLKYDTVGLSLKVTDVQITNIPSREWGGGVKSLALTKSPQDQCGNNTTCITSYITNAIETYDAGNAFDNYEVVNVTIAGDTITIELATRTWKHRLTCSLKTACDTQLYRTYEVTNFPAPFPVPSGVPGVAPSVVSTKHNAIVIGYPETANTHYYLSGCNLCDGGGGDDECTTNEDCADNNVCNGAEICLGGTCEPGTPLTCDDGLFCNGVEVCDTAMGCKPGAPVVCTDPDGSGCKTNACDESKDMCVIDSSGCGGGCTTDADCTDNNVCNGAEACLGGECKPGTPLMCDDGLFCNGVETCDTKNGCTPGTPVVCTDPDGPGCKTNACDESKDMCVIDISTCQCQTNADCDDKNVCNGSEICVGNLCKNGTSLVCDDGQYCNGVEWCDTKQGCKPGYGVLCPDPDGTGCKTNACDESKDMCVENSSKCGTYCGDGKKQTPNTNGTGGKKNDGYEECDGQEGVGTGVTCQGNCTCPAQSKYCPNTNICVPTTWPCIPLTKTINTGALYSGDTVIYTITYSNPSQYTWYNLELRDYLPSSLTGIFIPKEHAQNGQTFIWTGLTLQPGESKTITFSGTLICVGSGCVEPGASMCNFVELWQGSGQIASSQACAKILACKTDAQCPNTETCDAGMCVKNSMCSSLSVVPPVGIAPLKTNYLCIGSGNKYTITVADLSGKIITLLTGAQGMYTFTQSGNYTMTCDIDGDTGMKCYGKPLTIKEVNMLIDTAILQLDAVTTGYVGQTSWSGAKLVINPKDYLDLSKEAFIKKLSDAFYFYMLTKIQGTPNPSELAYAQQLIKNIVTSLVNTQCTESCRVPVTVGSGTYKTCKAFTTDDPLYIARSSGSIDVVCTPESLFSGNKIEIHCNNSGNTILSGYAVDQGSGVYGLSGTCGYVGFGQYTPQCIIAGQTHPLCSLLVTLGNGGGGGSNGGGSNGGGGGSHGGGGGSNGGGGGGPLRPRLTEPVCSEIDPPSLQVGEYLPFRWDLEATQDVDMHAQSCKDISASKSIPAGSLYCNFAVYNGSSLDDPIIILDHIPCLADKWKEDGIRLFNDIPSVKGMNYMGRWYTKIDQLDTKGIYGEYQIQLTSVDYESCDVDASGAVVAIGKRAFGENDARICAMNFAVSDGFMLQQGATLSTSQGDELVNYRYLDGRAVIGLRELQLLSDKKIATYQAGDIAYLTTTFVDRYVTRAVSTITLPLFGGISVKKVSNADIYVYDGGADRKPLVLDEVNASKSTPYTLIIRHADLVVKGNLKGKGMYIVPDGTVTFTYTNCDYQDMVEGMFITPQGFRADMIRNTNVFASNRCSDGRFIIAGSLIGPVPENSNFVKAKRSVLDQWFDVSYQGQATKVFEAASVLIKANPKLWSTLPPGAAEFGAVLTITK